MKILASVTAAIAFAWATRCQVQAQTYSFSTVLGSGGLSDGLASRARFGAEGVSIDSKGNIYVSAGRLTTTNSYLYMDGDHTIRKITQFGSNWVVRTLVGQVGSPGSADGTGSQARLVDPNALGIDSLGNIYTTDQVDQFTTSLRKITPSGVVKTLVQYSHGSDNPIGWGVAVDSLDNVFMTGYPPGFLTVVQISPSGVITTWATPDFLPGGMAFDPAGKLYLADTQRSIIRQITPDGLETIYAGQSDVTGTTDGTAADALFNSPLGLATDLTGNIYVSDTRNSTIRKITPDGVVSTLAGQPGMAGVTDGIGNAAQFSFGGGGLATDATGNIYVAEGEVIRKVTPKGVVATFAGVRSVTPTLKVTGMAVDKAGYLYLSSRNNVIYRVSPDGLLSTLAGQAGVDGALDGVGTNAQFNFPQGLTLDAAGNIYVADFFNNAIRRITPDGMVTTLAGGGPPGSSDGTGRGASFNGPGNVAVDKQGNVLVADVGNYTIRKVTPEGVVTTLAGKAGINGTANGVGSAARFMYVGFAAGGMAVDSLGNLYLGDYNTIRKITPLAVVTTLAGQAGVYGSRDGTGSAALFQGQGESSIGNPTCGLAISDSDDIYVADLGTIRKVTPAGVVTTIAGHGPVTYDYSSYVDGPADLARFVGASGVAFDGAGILYVTDGWGVTWQSIRKRVPTASMSPVVLGLPILSNGQIGCWISGPPGSTVAVESSSDLASWQLVGLYNLDGGTNLFLSPAPTAANQFFRARQ